MNGENAARIGERYFSSFSEYETAAALAKDCHFPRSSCRRFI